VEAVRGDFSAHRSPVDDPQRQSGLPAELLGEAEALEVVGLSEYALKARSRCPYPRGRPLGARR